jgi:hypothetical protein
MGSSCSGIAVSFALMTIFFPTLGTEDAIVHLIKAILVIDERLPRLSLGTAVKRDYATWAGSVAAPGQREKVSGHFTNKGS